MVICPLNCAGCRQWKRVKETKKREAKDAQNSCINANLISAVKTAHNDNMYSGAIPSAHKIVTAKCMKRNEKKRACSHSNEMAQSEKKKETHTHTFLCMNWLFLFDLSIAATLTYR